MLGCVRACVHACVRASIFACVCACVRAYVLTYACTHTHTCVQDSRVVLVDTVVARTRFGFMPILAIGTLYDYFGGRNDIECRRVVWVSGSMNSSDIDQTTASAVRERMIESPIRARLHHGPTSHHGPH